MNVRIVLEGLVEARRRRGLVDEVQLAADRVGELVDDRFGVIGPQLGEERFGPLGHPAEDVDVELHDVVDAGAFDLDDDVLPVGRGRAVDLRDRAAGEGLVGELAEGLFDGHAGVVEENALGLLDGKGGDVVLELFERGQNLRRQDVGSRGGDLSQLDEGRPEFLADADEPRADGGERIDFVLLFLFAAEPGRRRDVAAELEAIDEMPEAVLGQDLGDDAEPREGLDGFWQSGDGHV